MISLNEAITAEPPQVWLTSYYDFTPNDWGYLSFTDSGRVETIREESLPGFLAVIYGSTSAQTPPEKRGRILGVYQCTHETGTAADFLSPLGMQRKRQVQKNEISWNFGFRACAAWHVSPETSMDIGDFAPISYTPERGTSISRYATRLHTSEAKKVLDFDLLQDDVYGTSGDFEKVLMPAKDVFSPSRAGPISQTGHYTRESEGPKHLYILVLDGPTDAIADEPLNNRSIVKVGLSKSPEMRCNDFNRALPHCKLRWRVLNSTHTARRRPFANSKIAVEGEKAMKLHLDTVGHSLKGEFFMADETAINAAWNHGVSAATALENSIA